MQNYGIRYDRANVNFYTSKVYCNGEEMGFDSWSTNIQTDGGYSHGMRGVGIGSNSRSVTITMPPKGSGGLIDSMLRPSEVRARFPKFGDKIVVKVWRNSEDYREPDTVFTGFVESTNYDYSTGLATVTASDGLDDLLDTPVNVESVLAMSRATPLMQVVQALSQAGVGNTPYFHWNKTICTTPMFETTKAVYADPDQGAVSTGLARYEAPQLYALANECVAVPYSYAQNYDRAGDEALVCMVRGGKRPYEVKGWDDRTFMRVEFANGDQVTFGYLDMTTNDRNGYYLFHSRLGWLWTDNHQRFKRQSNDDGNGNVSFGIVYDKRGITFVVGGEYEVVYKGDLPGNSSGTRITKVVTSNSCCFDVRMEPDWATGIRVLKALPGTNVAIGVGTSVMERFLVVLDRVDGLQLGTVVKRFCEAYLAGFWLDEFARPTLYDLPTLEKVTPRGMDVMGASAMATSYSARSMPEWKRVQIPYHTTKLWYSTMSPKTRADYSVPVYQGSVEDVTLWGGGKQEFFIQPENERVSWGAVYRDIQSVGTGTKDLQGGSWVAATRLRDRYQDEILYTGVSGFATPLVNSTYIVELRDNRSVRGEEIVTRTPSSETGFSTVLTQRWRNMPMPVIRATWKSEKTISKLTVSDGWEPGMPVLKIGDDDTALLLHEWNAKALGKEIIRLSSVMKGDVEDYEIHPDPRVQVGDRRGLRLQDSTGTDKAVLYVSVSGIRLGYSHRDGLSQALSGVVMSEVEM